MKPIIIVSPGRAGSTLLVNTLISHSQIREQKSIEPLAELSKYYSYYHDFIRENFDTDPSTHILYYNGITESYKKIAKKKYMYHILENEDVVKLLYGHIRVPEVYDFLHECDCNIIHLCRKNISSQIFSAVYNRVTTEDFQQLNDQGKPKHGYDGKVLTQKRFTKDFYDRLAKERSIDSLFSKKIIKVFFEDLLDDWNYWIKLIQKRCGLNYEEIIKPENQNKRPKFSEYFKDFEIPNDIKKRCNKSMWGKT